MNDCLVTKLKETVNNDNLDIYGVMKLRVSSGTGESYFNFGVGDDSEIIMTLESDDENEYFTDYNNNKIGKTITAVKNQSRQDVKNAFRLIATPGTVVTIKDGYKLQQDLKHFSFYYDVVLQPLAFSYYQSQKKFQK